MASPIGKIMLTSVPSFSFEVIFKPNPNLSQRFLHRYNPMPVDLVNLLPFSPVKPFSKTLPKSLLGIPTPLSFILRVMLFLDLFANILTLLFLELYFIELFIT